MGSEATTLLAEAQPARTALEGRDEKFTAIERVIISCGTKFSARRPQVVNFVKVTPGPPRQHLGSPRQIGKTFSNNGSDRFLICADLSGNSRRRTAPISTNCMHRAAIR
jgi:hypothetical protein